MDVTLPFDIPVHYNNNLILFQSVNEFIYLIMSYLHVKNNCLNCSINIFMLV